MTARSTMTRRALLTALLASAAVLALPKLPALAAKAVPAKLTDAQKADLARVEAYLNSIRTLKSDFMQVAQNGATNQGSVAIQRPGKMRIEYAPPSPHLIVTSGSFLVYVEKDLKQSSYLPLDSSLAGFLVREQIKLSGDVTVTGFEKDKGAIRVSLAQSDERENGQLTLVFSDAPLQLRQWSVIDGQGQTTRISLMDPQFGVPVDPKLFGWDRPKDWREQN
ncbi:MAG TPA: outer membrane lipoprotein carrier protein LolA [Alphaproteobacteria bacterium]|nr:outer membrane lipoprotein carrier protein LolA [Alphaproteobacteria bacterium]